MSARAEQWSAGFFAVRVATLPMEAMLELGRDLEAPRASPQELQAALQADRAAVNERLCAFAARPEIQDAIAVASPELLDAIIDRSSEKASFALHNYLARMAGRPAPFGLFAALGRGEVGHNTRLVLPRPSAWRRHAELDLDGVRRLAWRFVHQHQSQISLIPNPTLYRHAGRVRYIHTSEASGIERLRLCASRITAPLERALRAAADGASAASVAEAVAGSKGGGCSATRYVQQLLDAQILRYDFGVFSTVPSPAVRLAQDFRQAGDARAAAELEAVLQQLQQLERAEAGSLPARLARSRRAISALCGGGGRNAIRVDLTVPGAGLELSSEVVDAAARAVTLLHRIAPPPRDVLTSFKAEFQRRFGEREVPLLSVVDPDAGIAFGADQVAGGDATPTPAQAGRARRAVLLGLIDRAVRERVLEVRLTPQDVEGLAVPSAVPLPSSVAVVFSLAETADARRRIVLHRVSGPPAARVLSRFARFDARLANDLARLAEAEQAASPDAVHAEIVHLPARASNLLVRPAGSFEIECPDPSSLPPERRIKLSDLFVSVREEQVILRSERLDRRVVPRLTSSHNWVSHVFGPARLLAAIGAAGRPEPLAFSWDEVGDAPFTPRLVHGDVVIATARWNISQQQVGFLTAGPSAGRWSQTQAWRDRFSVPRWIGVREDDRLLAIDLDNTLSVEVLLRECRRAEGTVTVQELYPPPSASAVRSPAGAHAAEIVLPLVRNQRPAPRTVTNPTPAVSSRRATPPTPAWMFPPGSRWTYVKLYSGPASGDQLLRDEIAPLVRALRDSNALEGWFFLRLADPQPHLRVRLQGEPSLVLNPVIELAQRAITAGTARDASIATYEREVERYGGPEGVELAERIFAADSDAALGLVANSGDIPDGVTQRWRIAVLGAELLLRDLALSLPERVELVRRRQARLETVLRFDADQKRELSLRLRKYRAELESLVALAPEEVVPPSVARLFRQRTQKLVPLARELDRLAVLGVLGRPRLELAASYLHMFHTRLHAKDTLEHELFTVAALHRTLTAVLRPGASERV